MWPEQHFIVHRVDHSVPLWYQPSLSTWRLSTHFEWITGSGVLCQESHLSCWLAYGLRWMCFWPVVCWTVSTWVQAISDHAPGWPSHAIVLSSVIIAHHFPFHVVCDVCMYVVQLPCVSASLVGFSLSSRPTPSPFVEETRQGPQCTCWSFCRYDFPPMLV